MHSGTLAADPCLCLDSWTADSRWQDPRLGTGEAQTIAQAADAVCQCLLAPSTSTVASRALGVCVGPGQMIPTNEKPRMTECWADVWTKSTGMECTFLWLMISQAR